MDWQSFQLPDLPGPRFPPTPLATAARPKRIDQRGRGSTGWVWEPHDETPYPDLGDWEGRLPGLHYVEWEGKGGTFRRLDIPHNCWPLLFGSAPPILEPAAAASLRAKLYALQARWGSRDYQVEASEFVASRSAALLALPVGAGKTLTAVQAARATDPDGLVLVITRRALASTWKEELQRLGEVGPNGEGWCELRTRPNTDAVSRGLEEWKARGLDPAARWAFAHPEILQAWETPLRVVNPKQVIIDEVHLFANRNTGRGRAVRLVTQHARNVYGLSGTPRYNKPTDIWGILDMLEQGAWGSQMAYHVAYMGAEPRDRGWVDGDAPTRVEDLTSRLRHSLYARTRAELGLILPQCYTHTIMAESSASTRKASARLTEALKATGGADPYWILEQLRRRATLGTESLRYLQALRQLASRDKIPTTVEHTASLVAQGELVIVFAGFIETAKRLQAEICEAAQVPVGCVHGGFSPRQRQQAVDAFRAGYAKVLVATYDVLGVGVNLQHARCVVHHDLMWVPALHAQVTGRVWRFGQDQDVYAYFVYARDTLDEILARMLFDKVASLAQSGEDTTDYGALVELGHL